MPRLTHEIVIAAIEGFEAQKRRIDEQIAELRSMLLGASATSNEVARPKRKISAAARHRMALGQKKRWAAIKETTPEPAKRKLSAAGRAAIVAALKKRWAAKRATAAKAKPAAKKAAEKKAPAKVPMAAAST